MTRRAFVRTTCAAGLALTALTPLLGLSSCAPTLFATGRLTNDGLLLDLKEFALPPTPGNAPAYRDYVVVRHDDLRFPLVVFRHGPTDYSALWLECTHLGSELQVNGLALQCPAHGSEFSSRGAVTNGPADAPLRSFPVTVDNQQLFIDLRRSA